MEMNLVVSIVVVGVILFAGIGSYFVKTSDRRLEHVERQRDKTYLDFTLRG